jgi:flagellar basal body-associated protein FliL
LAIRSQKEEPIVTSQERELLLLIVAVLLAVVSLYSAWLWLNLQITRRVISAMPIIQPANGHTDTQTSGGCAGLLVILLVVVFVIALLGAGW